MHGMTARWTFRTTPEGKRSVRVEWSDHQEQDTAGGRPVVTALPRRTAKPPAQVHVPLRGVA